MPPLLVPPSSTALIPTVIVPPVAPGVKASVPFVLTEGGTRNELGLLFVTVKLTVWLLSFVGPARIFVRALGMETATSYLSTVTEVIARLNDGAWFTGTMVTVRFVVLVNDPSSAVMLTIVLPLALVTGANTSVRTVPVPVRDTVTRFVFEETQVTVKLVVSGSYRVNAKPRFVVAFSRIVLLVIMPIKTGG